MHFPHHRYMRIGLPTLGFMLSAACGNDAANNQTALDEQGKLLSQAVTNASATSAALSPTPTPSSQITLDESSKMCVDILDANRAIGTPAVLNSCGDSNSQLFSYANSHIHVFVHKCLEVANGQNFLGAKVVINNCDPNSTNQMWTRKGRTWAWNNDSSKCLDLSANSIASGTPLQIWNCNSSGAQNWSDAGASNSSTATPIPAPPTPNSAFLPKVAGTCPPLKSGVQSFLGQPVTLWAANPNSHDGSLVLYWHGTGGTPQEATWGFGTAQINDVVAKGGMVAAFTSTTGKGSNLTGNSIWFSSDFTTMDEVVACAIRDLHIDPRRIYVSGASAGGLTTTWLSYARSGYIAAVAPLSGGMLGQSAGRWGDPASTPQDPCNVPFALVNHGGKGVDVYQPTGFDFAISSSLYEADIATKGGMSIDCNTGGGHVSGPPTIGPVIWQFFQDHPYKVAPEPYQGKLPASFPSWCKMGPVAY